jgi:hypothetical protein
MITQGFVAITLAIASANINYAIPWCHPGDKVTITAIIGDVKANLIHLKPESSRPCRINTVVGGVRGNKNAQRPRNCTAGRTIHAIGTVDTLAEHALVEAKPAAIRRMQSRGPSSDSATGWPSTLKRAPHPLAAGAQPRGSSWALPDTLFIDRVSELGVLDSCRQTLP